ncbi:MAG: HD domain-containing protein [Actinomycetes bacterium]
MIETKKPHVYLTDRFFKALEYATEAHKMQVRKSTNIAYISHPIGVAALILEAGGDEDQAIAGLLHDVAEDCGGEPRLVEINQRFGERVANIVRDCSDSLVDIEAEKEEWSVRKAKHIEHLKESDFDVLLVTAGDKTHNARAIVTDIQISGNQVWERFNAPRDQVINYYKSIFKVLQFGGVTESLLAPLESSIRIMEDSISK